MLWLTCLFVAAAAPVNAQTPTRAPAEIVDYFRGHFAVKDKGGEFSELIVNVERKFHPVTGDVIGERAAILLGVDCGAHPFSPKAACLISVESEPRIVKFVTSEDFDRARIVLKDRRQTHKLVFTGTNKSLRTNEYSPGHDCGVGNNWLYTSYWVGEAEGRVLGRRVTRDDSTDKRGKYFETHLSEALCV